MTVFRSIVPLFAVAALTVSLSFTGCSANHGDLECRGDAERAETLRAEAIRQRTASPTFSDVEIEQVPVVVHSRFDVPPLSAEQKRKYVTRAAGLAPQGRPIWFLLVSSNRAGGDVNVLAFYTPEVQNERLRIGQFAAVGDMFLDGVIRGAIRQGPPQDDVSQQTLQIYCQVAAADTAFAGEPGLPSGAELPFPLPTDLTSEDIVSLIDGVGAYRPGERDLPRRRFLPRSRDNPSSRVLMITPEGDGYDVLLGFSEGHLSGHGWTLHVVKRDGAFVVVREAEWVS